MSEILIKLAISLVTATFLTLAVVIINWLVGVVTAIRVLKRITRYDEAQLEALTSIMTEMNEKRPFLHGFWLWRRARPYLKRLSRK